jgi:hypothetical protein
MEVFSRLENKIENQIQKTLKQNNRLKEPVHPMQDVLNIPKRLSLIRQSPAALLISTFSYQDSDSESTNILFPGMGSTIRILRVYVILFFLPTKLF